MENLQQRFELSIGESLESFEYNGVTYEITGVSSHRDLITGGNPLFPRRQYIATANDGRSYEVYVYYYSKYENSNWYAVVDAIRPVEISTVRSKKVC